MARVIMLSATTGYQLRSFNDAAERIGCELLFATDRCHRLDDPWQDRAVAVRFHEPEASLRAIAAAVRERPVDGVIAVGDRPTVLAAATAAMLGLPGNPIDGAAASANKAATRTRLHGAGLPAPWHFTLPADAGAPAVLDHPRLAFPCVLKPLGLSGSRGVIRADDAAGAVAAFDRIRALLARKDVRALRSGMEDTILVEGYIDGREYALEGVLTAGRLQTFTIFDKPDPLEGPFFEETIYLTPPALSPATHRAIHDHVERAAAAIGLCHGPLHAEVRAGPGGMFVLELAPRPIGGLCSRVLRFEAAGAHGVPLEEVLLGHALGEDVSRFTPEAGASGVMMIPIPKRGLLKGVEGEEAARRVEGVEDIRISAKPDQLLEPLPEAGSYLGFIFARGATAGLVDTALRESHRRLRFVIDAPIPVRPAF